MRRSYLTDEELEQSNSGPKYEHVRPADVFGPNANGALASRIYAQNIRRYRELREAHRMELGEIKRPGELFDSL